MTNSLVLHIGSFIIGDKELQRQTIQTHIYPAISDKNLDFIVFKFDFDKDESKRDEEICIHKDAFLTSEAYYTYFDKVCAHQVSLTDAPGCQII